MPSNKMLINTDQLIDIPSICQCTSIRALPEGWNLSQLSLFRGLFLDRLSLHNRVDMGATSKPHTYNFESSWPNPARLFLTLPCGWIASDLKCEISFLSLHSNSGASGGNATLLTAAVSCEGKGHCYSTWHNYIPRERPFLSMSSSPNQMLPFFFSSAFWYLRDLCLLSFHSSCCLFTFYLRKPLGSEGRNEFSLARQLAGWLTFQPWNQAHCQGAGKWSDSNTTQNSTRHWHVRMKWLRRGKQAS